MPMVTERITYNVRNRGRQARGQDRNFDTVALAKLINSPAVQEKVKHGDMLGYFGHWPRIKLGMEPSEGGIIDGRPVSIPPALRTVELTADEEGNITHRAEFLDTNEGRIAARLYASKAGGFSSAITTGPGGSLPTGFYGFDYVFEPNFTHNRGHKLALDAVSGQEDQDEVLAIMDSVVSEANQASAHLVHLFDSLQAQHQRALEAMQRIADENAVLIEQLAAVKVKGGAVLDSAAALEDVRVAPVLAQPGDLDEFQRFRDIDLSPLQKLDSAKPQEDPPMVKRALRHFGLR